jgi:hypothetical protein
MGPLLVHPVSDMVMVLGTAFRARLARIFYIKNLQDQPCPARSPACSLQRSILQRSNSAPPGISFKTVCPCCTNCCVRASWRAPSGAANDGDCGLPKLGRGESTFYQHCYLFGRRRPCRWWRRPSCCSGRMPSWTALYGVTAVAPGGVALVARLPVSTICLARRAWRSPCRTPSGGLSAGPHASHRAALHVD